jgi:hypothetical protein
MLPLLALLMAKVVPFLSKEEPMLTSYDPTTRGIANVVRMIGPLICLWIVIAMLVGCAPTSVKNEPLKDVVLVPEKEVVNIPDETLRDCDPIPRLEERAYTQKELTTVMNKIITPYVDCRKRKRDAVKSLKDGFNISK